MSLYVHPKLSTIDYPVADVSRMALDWVMKTVYGEKRVGGVQEVFEPCLLVRESVLPRT